MKITWKPVRRGPIYCSSACGANCTWAQHQKIKSDAEKLAKRLGKGWTVHLHENMRWFGTVVSPCKRIKVSLPVYTDKFSAVVSEPGFFGGHHWGKDVMPEVAIDLAIASARKELERVKKLTDGLFLYD